VLTVICPPLFSDYMRTQLALRELAVSLAQNGQHVLRFDYRGTGDSSGEIGKVSVRDWLEDIVLAVREGREISGSGVVRLLGVRAGALLACRSVGDSREVQRVVLWDPVPDGAGYLQLLRRNQAALCTRNLHLNHRERRDAMDEYAGYTLSGQMPEDLRALDANAYARVPEGMLHVVSTSPASGFPVPGVAHDVAPYACNWDTLADNVIVPRPVLESLVACLTRP
jgi:pimeloyl-ACP methyl ester carboxylesterase